jgi:hypothetical protein
MPNDELEARFERLERVIGIQQQLIERYGAIARLQQRSIEALAAHAGAVMVNESGTIRAPRTNMN